MTVETKNKKNKKEIKTSRMQKKKNLLKPGEIISLKYYGKKNIMRRKLKKAQFYWTLNHIFFS